MSPEASPAADTTITTELGLQVPIPPAHEWREHTAARWKERDPASHQFALHLVRELGITNKSQITELVDQHRAARQLPGISRNSIIALFNDTTEFKPGEIDEIIRRRSSLLTADTLDKIETLLDKAKAAKDLGAAAMALTAVYNVKQLSSGGATRINANTADGLKARTFDAYLAQARAKLNAPQSQPELHPSRPAREIELVPVSNATLSHEEGAK